MPTINETRDALATTATTYTMAVGDTFNGALSGKQDEDWIKITLERGKTYEINLKGRGDAPAKAEDPILRLLDSKGALLVENDDIDTPGGLFDSRIVFTASADGDYYLSASVWAATPRDNSGDYTLSVALAGADTPTTPVTPTTPGTPATEVGEEIPGTNGSDTLNGTNASELIRGLGGNDTLNGNGGNDTLDGGPGSDILQGGPGADRLIGGPGADIASYEDSADGVTVRLHSRAAAGGDARGDTFAGTESFSYADDKGVRVTVEVPDIIHLTGSDADDILAGDERANTLRGGGGDDTLYGGPGGDQTNSDRLYGDDGNDKLYGGRGADRLLGGNGNDLLRGGAHNDQLEGEAGNDELDGGDGRDELEGGSGNDELDGGPGNDELDGGPGNDELDGGPGNDDLTGGDGEDVFRFERNHGDDVIEDFVPGEDRIDLRAFTSISGIDDNDLDLEAAGNNTLINLPGSGNIELEGIHPDNLGGDDFIFYDPADDGSDGGDDGSGDGTGDGSGDGTGDGSAGDPGQTVDADPDPGRIHGAARDDDLSGGGGNDVLYGGRGNDTLNGGADVDSFEGGPGDDVIEVDYDDFTDGKAAPDTGDRPATDAGAFDGGPGSDTLSFADFHHGHGDGDGDGVAVSLSSGFVQHEGRLAGALPTTSLDEGVTQNLFRSIENIIGSEFHDIIVGDEGDNIIEGGDGRDELDGGGGGSDTVSYRSSPSSVTIELRASGNTQGFKGHAAGDTLSNFENIIGSAYDDILAGNASANVIEGLAGADTLDGGGGNDTLSYAGSNAGVTIDLNRGTGNFDDTTKTIRTASGGHADGDKVKYGSFVNVTGSAYADTITGDNEANTLTGGAGNDKLNGEDGEDILDGGPGGDTLDGGDNTDTVTYAGAAEGVTVNLSAVSESNDVTTISNSGGRGEASGDRFIDVEKFIGSAHDDTFIAGPKADDINAGAGTDTISYERSRKAVVVDLNSTSAQAVPSDDRANEEDREDNYAQGDTLDGFENIIGSNASSNSAGDDTDGDGTYLHDTLTGDSSNNIIDGRGGNDTIDGRGGDDRLIGGSGNDMLTGGGGSDTFVFTSSHGKDTITDFGSEDKLELGSSGTISFTVRIGGDSGTAAAAPNVLVRGSSTIDLGTPVTGLTEANFVFNDRINMYRLTVDRPSGDALVDYYHVWGGPGDDRITGSRGGDTLDGGAGNDTLDGGAGDDTLLGGAGDDVIKGGVGADSLTGGDDGEVDGDTLSYEGSSRGTTTATNAVPDPNPRSGVTVTLSGVGTDTGENIGTHAAGDTINGGFENLTGSSYDDMLTGGSGVNVIRGGGGRDVLTGDGDGDHLEGGSGKDRLIGRDGDFLSYAGSGSRVSVDLSERTPFTPPTNDQGVFGDAEILDVIKVSGGDASGDIATGFNNVIGSRGGDTLTGDDNANELRGLGGNDTLTGGDGNDTLKGGDGNDTLKGGDGNDTLDGGPGADTLDGGGTRDASGTDVATYASAEAGVTVDLSGGNGGQGDAAGDSFDGIEQYEGSMHDDTFIAGDDPDHITGGPPDDTSKDTVSYARSDEGVTVDLSSDNEQADDNGYASKDTLKSIENVIGSNHEDTLTAANGGSVITGGKGDDHLKGGDDADTFVFAPGDGDDEINSFTITGGADRIDLSAFTSIASLDDVSEHLSDRSGTNIEIDLPGGGEIRLNNPTGFSANAEHHGLTADNFIFYTKRISGNEGDRFNNEINGGRGDDALYGEQGNDIINGGAGDDEIYGGEGKDTINGGAGNDWLDGGPGNDTFVFEPGNGNDVIMDWEQGDKIDLSAFKNADGATLSFASSLPTGSAEQEGNYVIPIPDDFGGGMITILDVPSGFLLTGTDGVFM